MLLVVIAGGVEAVLLRHTDQIDIESDECTGDEEKVHGLYQHEAQKVGVVPPTHTIIQPLAVMVKSVNAPIADKAMPATRQDDDSAVGAYFLHFKFFKQVHH